MSDLLDPTDPRVLTLPVAECGEPLIDLRTIPTLRIQPGRPVPYLRSTVVDRLITAQTLLPRGRRLLIASGHRPPAAAAAWPCPPLAHPTGGAVDLSLGDSLELDLDGRRALSEALSAAGLADLPQVWWHWSYGDAYWCYRTGAPAALYGPLP